VSESVPQIMWRLKQIAERDGVSVAAVSKSVRKQIEQHDLAVERDGRGRVSKIAVAQYDHNRGFFGNSAKRDAPRAAVRDVNVPGEDAASSFDEAKRQEAWLTVERKRLQKEEEMGSLIRADKLRTAMQTAGRTISAELSRLPNYADQLALAVSKEGEHGARQLLRKMATETGTAIADALIAALADVSEHDAIFEVSDE
jgi:hypothetical protein